MNVALVGQMGRSQTLYLPKVQGRRPPVTVVAGLWLCLISKFSKILLEGGDKAAVAEALKCGFGKTACICKLRELNLDLECELNTSSRSGLMLLYDWPVQYWPHFHNRIWVKKGKQFLLYIFLFCLCRYFFLRQRLIGRKSALSVTTTPHTAGTEAGKWYAASCFWFSVGFVFSSWKRGHVRSDGIRWGQVWSGEVRWTYTWPLLSWKRLVDGIGCPITLFSTNKPIAVSCWLTPTGCVFL